MRYLVALFMTGSFAAHAQSPEIELLQSIKPRAIGPASMSGRVTSIAVVEKDPNIMYTGTASGGLWKSTNGGLTWSAIFDKMDVASIGAIAINQENPSLVWAGTGEGNPRNSHNSGKGIYFSPDAGKTWKNMGLENTRTVHRIVLHPKNQDIIYAGAMGSIWGPSADRGVYRSKDGGKTWVKSLFVNESSGCAELVMDPSNPNKLFAAIYDYQRKPYTFRSGGKGSGIYMTLDGGETWTRLGETQGLPNGNLGRIGIAVSRSNPNKIYAIVESTKLELYRSDDGGNNWIKMSDDESIGNRPFYYNEIYVDPQNENHVISVWSQVSHSIDGGKTWSTLLDWNHVHPDHHAFYIHPENNKFMVDGNDGGLNISTDGGTSWRYVNNLPVGQFYHINVDDEIPYHIYGGLQDNGSWKGPGFTFNDGGIRNSDWKELLFGDGFDVIPLRHNDKKGYAAWQGGNIYFYDLVSGKSQSIQPVHPEAKLLRYNWNAGMAVHPTSENTIYYGSQFLHKSYNNGLSWKIISPDLSTNDTAKLHQAESGGLTIDATNAENYCTIISIAPAYSDTNVIYVGTDDGNLQLTRNGGGNWTNLTPKIIGAPKNAWIPFVQVSKTNAAEVWVVMNNYRQNDWQPYLFYSSDFGNTWKRMADAGKVSGHCLSVYQDIVEANLVFLGTDHGLFVSFNKGEKWTKWTSGMPSCPVQDIVYQERENDLILGTFGRSIYIFDDISVFRNLAKTSITKEIQILSGGHGYLASYTRPEGERFGADAVFEADNKNNGVPITFYAKVSKNTKTNKWEKSTLTANIFDSKNSKLRTFEIKMDSTGLKRIWWNMTADGIRFPTHRNMEKENMMPQGLPVPPGKYKIVISSGLKKDSAEIQVIAVKENPWNEANETERSELFARFKKSADRAYIAFEALKTAEETIKNISGQNYERDSARAELTKYGNKMKDSIAALKLLFMQEKDARYIEDVSQRLNDYLGLAFGFIVSDADPGDNCLNSLINAEKQTELVLNKVNIFFAGDWKKYQDQVQKEKMQLFKKMGEY